MAAKRGRRAPGVVFATLALLALNQALQFGESLAETAGRRGAGGVDARRAVRRARHLAVPQQPAVAGRQPGDARGRSRSKACSRASGRGGARRPAQDDQVRRAVRCAAYFRRRVAVPDPRPAGGADGADADARTARRDHRGAEARSRACAACSTTPCCALPSEMVVALPLAALLGHDDGVHCDGAQPRDHRAALRRRRSAGASSRYLLPVPFCWPLLQFALAERVVPQAESELKAWWDATAPPGRRVDPALGATPDGGPVSFERNSADGTQLRGLRIYGRDAAGLLESRTGAQAMPQWDGQDWRLDGVQRSEHSPTAGCSGSRADARLGNQSPARRCVAARCRPAAAVEHDAGRRDRR